MRSGRKERKMDIQVRTSELTVKQKRQEERIGRAAHLLETAGFAVEIVKCMVTRSGETPAYIVVK